MGYGKRQAIINVTAFYLTQKEYGGSMKQAMIDYFKYSEFFYCIKNILEYIKDALTRCPDCKGNGGYKDVILDDGTGPYYPCGFCDHGYMNVFKKIYWKIVLSYANQQDKKR